MLGLVGYTICICQLFGTQVIVILYDNLNVSHDIHGSSLIHVKESLNSQAQH